MKRQVIFLISVVLVAVNAADSRQKDNYKAPFAKNLSHMRHVNINHDETGYQWQEPNYEIEESDKVFAEEQNCCISNENKTEICRNGACTKPKNCTCNDEGYTHSARKSSVQKRSPVKVKICFNTCVNGTCASFNKCKCKSGYVKSTNDKNVCVPKCERSCTFGSCTDPNKCTCREDYEPTSDKYVCKPKCFPWCTPGRCEQPYECTCDTGFVMNLTACRPAICQQPCKVFERCARDNFCDCIANYRRPVSSMPYLAMCEPVCHRLCPTGRCATPNHCICNSGYKWNSSIANCDPVCDVPCVNGFSCVAPNKCDCKSGIIKKKTVTGTFGPIVEQQCISRASTHGIIPWTFVMIVGIMYTFPNLY